MLFILLLIIAVCHCQPDPPPYTSTRLPLGGHTPIVTWSGCNSHIYENDRKIFIQTDFTVINSSHTVSLYVIFGLCSEPFYKPVQYNLEMSRIRVNTVQNYWNGIRDKPEGCVFIQNEEEVYIDLVYYLQTICGGSFLRPNFVLGTMLIIFASFF